MRDPSRQHKTEPDLTLQFVGASEFRVEGVCSAAIPSFFGLGFSIILGLQRHGAIIDLCFGHVGCLGSAGL